MSMFDIFRLQHKEYFKPIKGTLLAIVAGTTVQACTRVGSEASTGLPTGPAIETTRSAVKADGGVVPKIIIKEGAPEEPVITIMGPEPQGTPSAQQEVPVTITLDGPTQSPTQEQSKFTTPFDEPAGLPNKNPSTQPATESQGSSPHPEISDDAFVSLEPEKLANVIKKIEQGSADDEISENGRHVEIYSSPLKNGMSVVLVKETIQKNWPEMQSSVVFYDENVRYVAYNTVQFGTHARPDGVQELRFGKGKSSAVVRNAYVTLDPSNVSVLLSTRRLDDSWGFLANKGAVSIYQNREEINPVTLQKTINVGAYVVDPQKWMSEQEWLLDQAESNHIYSVGRQSDGHFRRESIGDPLEINPSKNL